MLPLLTPAATLNESSRRVLNTGTIKSGAIRVIESSKEKTGEFFQAEIPELFQKRNSKSKIRAFSIIMFLAQKCMVLMRWILHYLLVTNSASTTSFRTPEKITREKNMLVIKNSKQYLQAHNAKKSHQLSIKRRTKQSLHLHLHEIANSIFIF